MRLVGLSASVLVILHLGGCSGADTRPLLDGKLVTGLTLKEDLTIPADGARTEFQHGKQAWGVNHFDPYCQFEVNTVSDRPQTVTADRFAITRIDHRILADDVTEIPVIAAGSRGCEDATYFETSFRLHSPDQANPRALICRNVGVHCFEGYRFLSPAEMQDILGPVFSWISSDDGE